MLGLILAVLLQEPERFAPQWQVGQEYVYHGSVKEMGPVEDWQVIQEYSLELRVLVSKVTGSNAELVFCTKLLQKSQARAEEGLSVHLTQAMVDGRGNITSCSSPSGKALVVDRPATWENGLLLPLPDHPLTLNATWDAREPGRQPRQFTWLPAKEQQQEQVITGIQESIDWKRPRGDSTAWRRSDQLTYSSRATLPTKVERLIERRAPAHRQVTGRIITVYSLKSVERLAGPMLEARLLDIDNIKKFQTDVQTLSALPLEKATRVSWQKLENRLVQYQSSVGDTPYREALITMHSTIQAALENRLSQVQYQVAERSGVEQGQLAPPFTIVTTSGETMASTQLKGRPTLIVFVRPETSLTRSLAEELPAWQSRSGKQSFHCVMLASREGVLPAVKGNSSNIFQCGSCRQLMGTFGVVDTPHFVLLDGDGTLLASMTGWGVEIRSDIEKLIRKELAKTR